MEIELGPVEMTGPHLEMTHGRTMTWVPDPLVAEVTAGRYKATITLKYDQDTRAFGVAGLEVDPPAKQNILRALGMGDAAEEIVRRASMRFHWDDDLSDWVSDVDSEEDVVTPTDARRALTRGRKRISDEEVKRAADLYRAALEDGTTARRATATVAQQLGISVAAAGVRIRRAREELGILGPAVGTKAGEGER